MEAIEVCARRRAMLGVVTVGRGSSLDAEILGVPPGVLAVQMHIGQAGGDSYGAVEAVELTGGRWRVYASGLYFPEAGTVAFHLTGLDGNGGSVWLGRGTVVVEPSVLHADSADVPLIPQDTYVRNPETGLYHRLTCVIEDGEIVPQIDGEGVAR